MTVDISKEACARFVETFSAKPGDEYDGHALAADMVAALYAAYEAEKADLIHEKIYSEQARARILQLVSERDEAIRARNSELMKLSLWETFEAQSAALADSINEREALSARIAELEVALRKFACNCPPNRCSQHGDGENPGCWMGHARDILS